MAENNVPFDPSSAGMPRPADVAAAPAESNGSPSKPRRRSSATAKGQEDTETCRICRSEGTPAESLFYPCRCSGSIKYVHQDCLMEWLSHSQKKYCELCQTPFRFTKLYHPHMPKALPTTVFLGKAISHVLRWLVTWARAGLVCLVWLVALPYAMRVVWRTLFWIADGGWARDRYIAQLVMQLPLQEASASRPARGPLWSVASTTPNSTSSISIPSFLQPFSQTLNMSAGTPYILTMLGRILSIGGTDDIGIAENNTAHYLLVRRLDSLFSEVSVLQHLTKWPAVNRKVVDIMEGLTITLSVVVAFILIFLIREWVIQQQPLLNAQVPVENNDPPIMPVEQVAEIVGENDDQAEPVEEVEEERHEETPPPEPSSDAGPGPSSLNDSISRASQQHSGRNEEPGQTGASEQAAPPTNGEQHSFPRQTLSLSEIMPIETDPETDDSLLTNGNRPRLERGKAALANEVHRDLEEEEVLEPTTSRTDANAADDDWAPLRVVNDTTSRPAFSAMHPLDQEKDKLVEETAGPDTMDQGQFNLLPRADQPPDISKRPQSSPNEVDSDHERQNMTYAEAASIPIDVNQAGGVDENDPRPNETNTSHEQEATEDHDPIGPAAPTDPQDPAAAGSSDQSPDVEGPRPEPTRLTDRLVDFLYGDLADFEPPAAAGEDMDQDDEHIVQDFADEEPFVPFEDNHIAAAQPGDAEIDGPLAGEEQVQDPEVAAAAAEAGIDVNDQDAIDDAEDLEGMLELIGMQGPLTGLFQNALFSAVLIALTVATAAWFPYLWGKALLLFMGSPIGLCFELPVRMVVAAEGFLADVALLIIGGLFYIVTAGLRLSYTLVMQMDTDSLDAVLRPARSISETAFQRLSSSTSSAAWPADKDYLHASIASHAALLNIEQEGKQILTSALNYISQFYSTATSSSPITTVSLLFTSLWTLITALYQRLASIEITIPNFFVFDGPNRTSQVSVPSISEAQPGPLTVDPLLVFWSAWDRTLTIGLGYLSFAILGSFYLSWRPPLFSNPRIRKVEQAVTDVLTQAGGVLKVILIISIEMMAFPLFCGFLLDLALMPLFENASIDGRFAFALGSPWISGFVHWFVGTCYMFHFALFVSMCRKIMRPGVLYFIRDPDDPTFHPVRDVLERSVATQLRKIAFSAIVYGALIVLCLGGVVWGLWAIFEGVLPLHWSSSKSALEFPLDILFYNFLTPLVLRHAKPSDALHAMYKWWFRRCARFLRLSDFLFGERLTDEEGHPLGNSYLETSLRFLRPWKGTEQGKTEQQDVEADFKKTGRYVRAPATDQVRIPKGEDVFVQVDEHNQRLDGKQDEDGVHALDSSQTKMVYIPPWFTARISAFVLTIWLFAAVTGCGMTVVPLIVGRRMCHTLGIVEKEARVNDIYAFSFGIYTLGSLVFLALRLRNVSGWIRQQAQLLRSSLPARAVLWQALKDARMPVLQAARVIYVYSALLIALPLVFSAILELYLLLPLHTMSLGSISEPPPTSPSEIVTQHNVHIVQDWTLGVLYTRIAMKLIQWNAHSLLARAARAVTAERGPLNPSAALATRYFILPCAALAAVVIGGPYCLAEAANRTIFVEQGAEAKMLVCRLAYPLCSALAAGLYFGWLMTRATDRWRGLIRDEVYLIGERLHNFGEKRAAAAAASAGAGHAAGRVITDEVVDTQVGG